MDDDFCLWNQYHYYYYYYHHHKYQYHPIIIKIATTTTGTNEWGKYKRGKLVGLYFKKKVKILREKCQENEQFRQQVPTLEPGRYQLMPNEMKGKKSDEDR